MAFSRALLEIRMMTFHLVLECRSWFMLARKRGENNLSYRPRLLDGGNEPAAWLLQRRILSKRLKQDVYMPIYLDLKKLGGIEKQVLIDIITSITINAAYTLMFCQFQRAQIYAAFMRLLNFIIKCLLHMRYG
eukprot:6186205-Pleurochrysis_carterae.AAC.2